MDQEQLDALANAAWKELARQIMGISSICHIGKQWDLLRHQSTLQIDFKNN